MYPSSKYAYIFRSGWRQSFVSLATWLLLGGVVAAQYPPAAAAKPDLVLLPPNLMSLRAAFSLVPGVQGNDGAPPAIGLSVQANNGGSYSTPNAGDAPAGVHRITLEQAKQMATGGSNPLVRLGELQVEIAKQHRLGVQAMYFPNIGAQFLNLHLNKRTGPLLGFDRLGRTVPVNIVGKNQTAYDFSVVQPVTPLFAIHQLVKIARADENIARAKAGMPVAETAAKVEKNLLRITHRRTGTDQRRALDKIQAKWQTASNSGAPRISAVQESDMIAAEKALTIPTSKVKELTTSLVSMIGLPEGTRLEAIPPAPLEENLSLQEVTDKMVGANPEVIAAEQTAIKAHAGSKLSKMEYFPSLAVVGGYTNQTIFNTILPRDFSYIGFMATFTVFDFGKREAGVKEARAQAEAADLGVQLTKAKVAEGAKKSYFELERSRKLSQLARRMVSATRVVEARYQSNDPEFESAGAKMEADMFRAELEYRQAYAQLKNLMGDK